ncbi:MAG TPA: substrate-binding domain-containing protein [Bryobacteraceae bacterium]|nr:substrate-binding domain-containing protein [Bryobacteraceae bacterium]
MPSREPVDRYVCRTIARACDVLEAFRETGDPLRLKDVAAKTGLSVATAFRILFTLEQRGIIAHVGDRQYQLNIKFPKRRRYRVGYAGQSQEFAFSRTVAEGVTEAASKADIDLVVLDNRYSPKVALRNVETFVREHVELVIEFQTDEHVAPIISSKLLEAGIPIVALEIPHPGAVYYGANNYGAGVMGGRFLGRWAKQHWDGIVDEVLLLELPMAGALPRSRLTGTLAGIREILPSLDDSLVSWLDGHGQFGGSLEAVRKHLRHGRRRQVLIGAINDPSALGALRAFEEAGRAETCVVMGQNAALEARAELRRPESRLIGSVAYFPERYGEEVVSLCLNILQRKPVPPAVFVKHQLATKENVDRLYPNDALISSGGLELLLLKSH